MKDMNQIYKKYMPQVYKYLYSLCCDSHLAEELTQETFFQAMKTIDTFRGECKLYVWLCQIGKNLWYKELKQRKKENVSELSEDIPASMDIPESTVVQRAEVIEMFKLLHALEEPMREVMYLRLNGNFSFREIGEIMNRDENWARVTFYRGKQKIRKESRYEM